VRHLQQGHIKAGRFFAESQSGILVGDDASARHVRAAEDASPAAMTEGSLSDRPLVDVKVFLLNIEYAVLITRLDQPLSTWMNGLRNGWVRLVTSAATWRDLRQACCMLEVALLNAQCPLENYFAHLYGDPGIGLRTKTASSLAARVAALDQAINYEELSRQATARTVAIFSAAQQKVHKPVKKRGPHAVAGTKYY
jgi:hypothetical protein